MLDDTVEIIVLSKQCKNTIKLSEIKHCSEEWHKNAFCDFLLIDF